jgi:hypothetical protein
VELLIAALVVTFLTGIRREGTTAPMRTHRFVIVCVVFAAAYFGQRVI